MSLRLSPVPLSRVPLDHCVALFADPPGCGCPTCCTPPTKPPTMCSAGAATTCCPRAVYRSRERWFTRIHGDDELDIWLISWVPGHATELHDHGGSLGALTVLSGSLNEFRWDGQNCGAAGSMPAIRPGSRWAGCTTWCGRPGRTVGRASRTGAPTLSVHAYSPPLTAMSYYEVTDRNSCAASAPN